MNKESQLLQNSSYYISYIEAQGHASIMLSEQKKDSDKIEITCQIGFVPADVDYVSYFSTYPGKVWEEVTASKILYSKTVKAKHRTYEISESEYTAIFHKINSDRRQNLNTIPIVNDSPTQSVEGGPRYQLLSQNCKNYAISFIEQLDPEAAKVLKNKSIQRPNSRDSLLTEIKKEDLSCPMKDKLVSEIKGSIKKLEETFKNAHLKNKDIIFNYLQSMSQHVEKISFTNDFCNAMSNLSNQLENECFGEDDQQLIYKNTGNIEVSANSLIELSKSEALIFCWNELPTISRRVKLDSCSNDEKKILSAHERYRLAIESLDKIITRIDKNISSVESRDSLYLKNLIEGAKREIVKHQNSFERKSFNVDEYVRQINFTIKKLETKVSSFQPTSESTWSIIKFIKRILSGFNENPETLAHSSFIKNELNALKKQNSTFDKNNNISFFSHPKTTVDETEDERIQPIWDR